MRNDKIKETGIVGSGGVCIDGDIAMRFGSYHSASMFFAFRIMLAFLATFSTALLAVSFTDAKIRPVLIFYDCAVSVLSLSLMFSKHSVVRICSALVAGIYAAPIIFHIKMTAYGFMIAANGYLTKGELPEQGTGQFKHLLTTQSEVSQSLYYFFTGLIFIVALGAVIACVMRIDFPVLFIVTFPVVELGLYLGFEVPVFAALLMIVSWVTVLSMNIINHTTNKAGRKNTFAVHERTKTFYFTSSQAKAEFYTVYIRFVALLTAGVFILVVLFSKISGFYRPASFDELRYNLHHAVERFDLTHADDFLIDVNGGSNLYGVTTVGGTNGGVLGTTNGITFNGSKALQIKTEAFNYTMYLRGYVAGEYKDNKWQPHDGDSTIREVGDELAQKGYYVQDLDYMLLDGYDESTGSHTAQMEIKVKGACSKFVYAPYGTDYSTSSVMSENEMTPYNDAYVRISQSKTDYNMIYKNFSAPDWYSRSAMLGSCMLDYEKSIAPTMAMYEDYISKHYTKSEKLKSLDEMYDYICTNYLDGSPEYAGYQQVCQAIKLYFHDMGFTYDTNPGKTPDGEDFIEYFLTKQKKGYCAYFASVGAQLMRKFGYPSRYVEGYMILPSQLNISTESDGIYDVEVKDKCAHAWAEVFIDGVGWVPAEFTPGYDNDNPNLTPKEKGTDKKNDSSSQSSKPDTSSSSSPEKPKSDSSKSNVSKSGGNNSKPASDSRKAQGGGGQKTGGKSGGSNSSQAGKPAGKGGTNSGGKGGGVSAGISPAARTVLMTLGAIVIGIAAVLINRRRNLDKMHDRCSQKDLNKRVMAIYSYSLKYLSVLNIEVKKNISDMQLCNELLVKCHEQRIHELDSKLAELTAIAVQAHMSPERISEEDAEKAAEILRCISEEVVAKRADALTMLSAKFLYCLY